MATLGENLKAIRKAKKMTQKELAQKSGVKQSVISDLETGNAKSTGSILELANALGVTAEELKKRCSWGTYYNQRCASSSSYGARFILGTSR